jgi:hypothetical protein
MYPTPSGLDLERCRIRRMMLWLMSVPCGVRALRVFDTCVEGAGGLASIRSIPSGIAAKRISGEMVRTSLGRYESQSCKALCGRRCGNPSFKNINLCEAAMCASGYVSTHAYCTIV